MSRIYTWPEDLPATLEGLYEAIVDRTGDKLVPSGELSSIAHNAGAGDAVVVVLDAGVRDGVSTSDVLEGVRSLALLKDVVVVFVVGDGYLGTDDPDLSTSMSAAAAVSAARSVSIRRRAGTRANVVCIPGSFFGDVGSQRGPLAQAVECTDVAAAAAFFLGDEATYVNGQVLFVNGGRQVFSSMSA